MWRAMIWSAPEIPFSEKLLRAAGAQVEMVGCATLTCAPYAGPRWGVLHVDNENPDQLTQCLPLKFSWPAQYWRAVERLQLLQRPELVHTTRLHIVLPCLAMGTPVQMPARIRSWVQEPGRLTILEELGFEFGKPQVLDVSPIADRIRKLVQRI